MLPIKNRLKLSGSSKQQFIGKKFESKHFKLIYKKGDHLKAAIIVSKKVAPKATERNRIKRVISEALRTKLKIKGKVLIIVKENISGLKADQATDALRRILEKT